MALARVKVWVNAEVLEASDLNSEFNNIVNNPISLISPLTANVDCDGKSLTSAVLPSPKVTTAILDTNGNELLKVTATASAVNELTLANAATTGSPALSATGSDTNINVNLVPKGTGRVQDNAVNLITAASTDTLTNKTLTAPVISTISNTGTLTLPTSTDTLVGRATTDTLTNKTLTTPVIASISNSGTITVPTGTDTLVGRATTDTLTNKTLTSPVINTQLTGTATGGTPSTNTLGDVAAEGTSTTVAKSDHKHDLDTFASRARAVRTTAQSIPNATHTQVTYTAEEYDGLAEFASDQFVVGTTGGYLCIGQAKFASNITGQRIVQIYVNGAAIVPATITQVVTSGVDVISFQCMVEKVLTAGDTVRLYVYQDSAGALNLVEAYLSVSRKW